MGRLLIRWLLKITSGESASMTVHIVTREQARRQRHLGLIAPRVLVPTRKLTPLLERPDAPPPAKLSAEEAARCFNVHQGGRLWR